MMQFLIILKHDLLLSFCNLSKTLASFLFAIIFIAIFFLLSQNQETEPSIAIWFALFSSLIFSSADFLKKDFEDGSLEQMLISFQNFEVFILAKMLANWLVYCLPLAIIAYFVKPEINFLILFLLASLAINCICCFCGSLAIAGSSAPMIATIALPLLIPILLISCGEFQSSLQLLSGIALLLTFTLIFATAKIVKIAEE